VKFLSGEGPGEKVKLKSDDGTLILHDLRSDLVSAIIVFQRNLKMDGPARLIRHTGSEVGLGGAAFLMMAGCFTHS
jgi:hypothetical protein